MHRSPSRPDTPPCGRENAPPPGARGSEPGPPAGAPAARASEPLLGGRARRGARAAPEHRPGPPPRARGVGARRLERRSTSAARAARAGSSPPFRRRPRWSTRCSRRRSPRRSSRSRTAPSRRRRGPQLGRRARRAPRAGPRARRGGVRRARVERSSVGAASRPSRRRPALVMRRCPFRELAERYPRVICSFHAGLIDGALVGARRAGRARGPRAVGLAHHLHRPPRAARRASLDARTSAGVVASRRAPAAGRRERSRPSRGRRARGRERGG